MTSVIDQFLAASKEHAATLKDPLLESNECALVITCMDPRLEPTRILGIKGNAAVMRNAGGSVKEGLRSIIIAQHIVRKIKEIFIMHHTECGMLRFTQEEAVAKVNEQTGQDVSHIDFECFSNLEDSVRKEIEYVKSSKLIAPDTRVWGGIYDVKTGKLTEVN